MSDSRLILPDLWQQDALRALRQGEDVVIQAPTGAGKTHVFELLIKGGHKGQAVYTVPTRALANDKRAEWQALGWDVGIATGDVSDNLGAPVIVATLETQRHRFLEGRHPDLLVVDEYQMLADSRRGAAYETVLAIAPPSTQLLLLSGSVSNPKAVAEWLRGLGRKVTLIEEHTRPIPLEEVSLDALETREPAGIKGHIARAVIRAVLADLGPVLVFAPRRRAAEQIARDIAAGLPLGTGPQLSPSQRAMAGDDLNRLLRQGVGLHHSGLTFDQRTELIEPWAKAGKLSVVVATTGLASGINFSLRSVLVTDRRYAAEHAEREVRPDELLQMFGRAGRRGLDDRGFALWTGDSPRLGEAKPLQLKRSDALDWPAFLSVMRRAEEPKSVATKLAQSLFTREPIDLALDRLDEDLPTDLPAPVAGTTRHIHEICGRNGTWQRERPTHLVPLSQALIYVKDTWHPALSKPDSLRGRDSVQVKLDYSRADVRVWPDADNHPLINPPRRQVEKQDINLREVLGGGTLHTARAGRLWKKLGLIDTAGRPTERGHIASLFQHGEGLAVAAALEDHAYDAHAIAWDLAELRAGERVASAGRNSSRLGACCRLAYKSLTAEGYLREGLPAGFGEGCAEALKGFALHGKITPVDAEGHGPGQGDLERAVLEWRSTLQLIAHGPAHPSPRWQELRTAAQDVLGRILGPSASGR
ncbi:MAG: DEAD/DEAH box helicase [Verrucomicrobia bacterium]|nr:DEAD/DEAH box helicase [Verrucomicrobiota bacterium]